MLLWRGEGEEFHHIQQPHLEAGDLAVEDLHRRQGLPGGHVAGAGHHHIGIVGLLALVVVAGPAPQANALGHVPPGLLQVQILQMALLIRHDDVAHICFRQGHLRHRQQAVGIGRQIHPHHRPALIAGQIDEAGILMGEAVVILAPYGGGDQAIPGTDRRPPAGVVNTGFQPFAVLVEHGGDHVGEGFVGMEEAVSAGK